MMRKIQDFKAFFQRARTSAQNDTVNSITRAIYW